MVSRLIRRTLSALVFVPISLVLLVSTSGCNDSQVLDLVGDADDDLLYAPEVDDDPAPTEPVIYDYIDEQKFNVSSSKWLEPNMTWCIETTTSDLTLAEVEGAITRAWAEWTRVSTLTFEQTERCNLADFVIRFEYKDHEDGYPFDGPSGVLAHATFPRNGTIHFDDDEEWTVDTRPHGGGAKDLQTVALHEFGHSLGLRHSDVESAVMYAYYGGSLRTLRSDDSLGVQSIYGTVGARTPDHDDHGDTRQDATLVGITTTEGNIEVGGDVDYFAFDAGTYGMWTVGTAGSTDTVCTLYEASGNPVAENDDAPGSRNCRIDMELGQGRYFVRVRHYDPGRTGRYLLSIGAPPVPDKPSEPEPEPEPEPADPGCSAGEICSPITVSGFPFSDQRDTRYASSYEFDAYSCAPNTNESGGEYVYQVDLHEPGTLNVAVNDIGGDGIDIDVHLLGALDSDACIARHNAQVREVLGAGRYYVVVDTWVNSSGTAYPGAYTITMSFVASSSNLTVDHGDTFEAPSPVESDTTLEAAIDRPGDNDLFRFTTLAAAVYTIETHGDADTVCQLFDVNLNVEAETVQADHTSCSLRVALAAGETYLLRVRHADLNATGSYTLSLGPSQEVIAQDSDQDGIPDTDDLCSNTQRGALVWRSGSWVGCAAGQVRD